MWKGVHVKESSSHRYSIEVVMSSNHPHFSSSFEKLKLCCDFAAIGLDISSGYFIHGRQNEILPTVPRGRLSCSIER